MPSQLDNQLIDYYYYIQYADRRAKIVMYMPSQDC
jgi:hypothetical protein